MMRHPRGRWKSMVRETACNKRRQGGRTKSESLFETYLGENNARFDYEPSVSRTSCKPDYHVRWGDRELIVEVKELHERRPEPPGASSFDPYRGIRKEIHEARKQFHDFKEYCCVLVLYNANDWEFRDWPYVLFGAMLGDAGIQMPFNPDIGKLLEDEARPAFLDGGKMVDPKSRRQQNTTFSAIGVLGDVTIPNPEFEREYQIRVAERRAELGVALPVEEILGIRMALYEHCRPTLGEALQLKVFENPLARKPLPEHIFCGNYDARYRFNHGNGKIERVFAGEQLRNAERVSDDESDMSSKIERFTCAIVKHFEPEQIVLFGSYAYGSEEPGSDVDILVIFPGDGSSADRSLEIRKRLIPGFPLDLLTRSASEVRRLTRLGDPFMCEILEMGRTLYPHKAIV